MLEEVTVLSKTLILLVIYPQKFELAHPSIVILALHITSSFDKNAINVFSFVFIIGKRPQQNQPSDHE